MEKSEKLSIGKPDQKRVNRIVKLIDLTTTKATHIKWALDSLYKDVSESVPLEYFFEFVKSKNPEELITQRFVEMKSISIPGVSLKSLIANKLIDIPEEEVKQALQDRTELLKLVNLLQAENYSIRLSEIFDAESNNFGTDAFFETLQAKVIQDLTVYTQSESESLIVSKIQAVCDAINELVELDVLPKDERCIKIDFFLRTVFYIDKSAEKLVSVSPQIFRNQKMKRFASSTTVRQSTTFNMDRLLS